MMAIQLDEMPDSRTFNQDGPSYFLRYKSKGEQNDYIVQAVTLAATPLIVSTALGILNRQPLDIVPDGYGLYIVTIPYSPRKRAVGEYAFNFDTSGGVVRVTAALAHVASYPSGGGLDSDPHKGAIGVKDGTAEGADLVIPALRLGYTFRHAEAVVSESFARQLARNTGKTNLNEFRGFAPGELLFLGASGSGGTSAVTEVGYQFAASENVASFDIGAITGIAKKGHDYLWIEFKKETSSDNKAAVQPSRVHIERVFRQVDFASVFGWE